MKFIYFLIISGFVYSCAPTTTSLKTDKLNAKTINVPELYKTNQSEVGETMVQSALYYQKPAVKIESLPSKKSTKIKLEVGQIIPYTVTRNGYDIYIDDNSQGIFVSEKNGKASYYTINGPIKPVGGQIEFSKTLVDVVVKNSFKREFIYNGKTGNGLKFTYREFKDDMARPAFTQDLQYDLSESKIIGFQGMRIEILEATNITVTYKLLSEFNKF